MKTKRTAPALLAAFSLLCLAACNDRLFDNPYDPDAEARAYELLSTLQSGGIAPLDITFSGDALWAVDASSRAVALNNTTGALIRELELPQPAAGIAYDGVDLWLSVPNSSQLVLVNIVNGAQIRVLNLLRGSFGPIDYAAGRLYVADRLSNAVLVVDPAERHHRALDPPAGLRHRRRLLRRRQPLDQRRHADEVLPPRPRRRPGKPVPGAFALGLRPGLRRRDHLVRRPQRQDLQAALPMRRVLLFLAAAAWALFLPAKELLEIKGDYLIYSYDFNYISGQGNLQVKSRAWTIRAGALEVDVAGRVARASRECRVEAGRTAVRRRPAGDRPGEPGPEVHHLQGEHPLLDPAGPATAGKGQARFGPGRFRRDGRNRSGGRAAASAAAGRRLTVRDPEALKRSLVYFLNERIVITTSYRVYGYGATVFIEGVQSLSFKKFKLDQGVGETDVQGMGIDKLWFYPSQGVVVNSHMTYEKPIRAGTAKTVNSLDFKYDLFNITDTPPRGKIYFNSASTLDLSRKSALSLNADYVTGNMASARLTLLTKWTPGWSSEWAAEYSRTTADREELWLRLRSNLQQKALGALSLDLGYEKEKQYRAVFSLQNQAVKNIRVSLQHSFSRLLFGQDQYNRQSQSSVSLSYTHRLFQMAADYSFHKDLLQDQSQGTPRFSLNATPFRLYHGLLQVNVASSLMVNQLNLGGRRDDQTRANLSLSLQSEAIRLGRGPAVTFSLAAEQLLDPERSNRFTSLGGILKCSQSLAGFADLDFLYNYNTRRQTEAWLIQGSTSQDWSAVLRLKEGRERLQGWVSVSYDSKNGNFTSGYLDCAVHIVKNWHVQTQMNYDFMFRNFNYDLYLIRRAGRIMVRASYRSLSRKFLLEVLPQ